MPDVIAVLRRHGILVPELMVQAAQLERVDLAVAATILVKETGGGRNVYGRDPVPTGGHYTKGGPVTRQNYLAYRAWMRAGTGRRQGVGPCQCTSAQYQDTADALGGCWDPLANMRSGFRGMHALVHQYGVQQGARRYNGSGPAAEAYGRDFLAHFQAWQSRLAGASPPPPLPEEDHMATPREIWDYVLPDPYPGAEPKPARDLLGWAATHAAHARFEAVACKAAVAAVARQVATGDLSEAAVLERLDTAVREALAALPTQETTP